MKHLPTLLCLMMLAILCAPAFSQEQTTKPKPSQLTFDDYRVIVDTNIFVQKKDPPKHNQSSAPNDSTPKNKTVPTPDIDMYLLFGIILENDDQFTAMIEHKQSKTLKSLHVGDKLDVFDITSMTISSVIFTLPDNHTVEIFVGQSIDANGETQHPSGWQATATTDTPANDKELSILEKMRKRRESQLKKDKSDAK